MATVTKGQTFGATETITNTKLHTLVDDATVTGIVNADVSAGAAIAASKINLTSSGYLTTGANFTITGVYTYSTAPVFSIDPTFSTGNGLVPSGCILMWSGSVATIPTGWVICDGNNSTPNLTDRFVIHADNDSGGTNDVGDTGGASTHQLSIAEMPAHTHDMEFEHGTASSSDDNHATNDGQYTPVNVPTLSTGGDTAHTNRDKYYALAYIMKT